MLNILIFVIENNIFFSNRGLVFLLEILTGLFFLITVILCIILILFCKKKLQIKKTLSLILCLLILESVIFGFFHFLTKDLKNKPNYGFIFYTDSTEKTYYYYSDSLLRYDNNYIYIPLSDYNNYLKNNKIQMINEPLIHTVEDIHYIKLPYLLIYDLNNHKEVKSY